jgi:hypothetical protein
MTVLQTRNRTVVMDEEMEIFRVEMRDVGLETSRHKDGLRHDG